MRRPLPPDTSVDDVEHAFYEALHLGDVEALMACWIDDEEPVCVHPAGPRLVGLAAIREAFARMFERGPIAVRAEVVHRAAVGHLAVHSVVERVDVPTDDGLSQAVVNATHVYARTAKGWRLVVHHASPAATPIPEAHMPPSSGTLH